MTRTLIRRLLPWGQGLVLGTLASTTLIMAGIQGGAFESHPRPTINIAPVEAPAPVRVRVDLPFAYRGVQAPSWCMEDMPCWTGSAADGRRWTRIDSALADALAEGPHPRMVPPTRLIERTDCFLADTTGDIACMSGWMSNVRDGRRF